MSIRDKLRDILDVWHRYVDDEDGIHELRGELEALLDEPEAESEPVLHTFRMDAANFLRRLADQPMPEGWSELPVHALRYTAMFLEAGNVDPGQPYGPEPSTPLRLAELPEAPSDAARKEARSPAPGVNYVPLAYASQAVHAAMAGENQKAYRLIDQDVRCMPEGPSEYERGWQAGYAEAGCQIRGETTYTPSDAVESVEEHVGGWILVDADSCAREEETGEIIDADDIGGAMLADIERLPEGKWWVVLRSQPTPTSARLPWATELAERWERESGQHARYPNDVDRAVANTLKSCAQHLRSALALPDGESE